MERSYKTTQINSRRYLGNKYRLLSFIRETIEEYCNDVRCVADLFSGTGAVASIFQDKTLITNDILYSNYISNYAWFSSESFCEERIISLIETYNASSPTQDNYMSETFADTFFSRQDCRKIGYIREHIEDLFRQGAICFKERAILITSLLYAMDKIAKTCGHYDAYRKGVTFDRHLELSVPLVYTDNQVDNRCYNQDINKLAGRIEADLVYLDPPYNSRQYCDAYHLLENVATWQKPEVEGVARKMDRTRLKSAYCTRQAATAFAQLIQQLDTRYILLSYNNMQTKGNDRSNARMSDEDIVRILSTRGEVHVFSKDYKAFTTGKSDRQDNQERLFLCTIKS